MRKRQSIVVVLSIVLLGLLGIGGGAVTADEAARLSAGSKPGQAKPTNLDQTRSRPNVQLELFVDDETAEDSLGWGNTEEDFTSGAIWLNRFSPLATEYPLLVEAAVIAFPGEWEENTLLGKSIRILAYHDADSDGNPANATLIHASTQTISAVDNFAVYPINVNVTQPGDLYVGWEDQWAETGPSPRRYPAFIDTTAPKGRSYLSGNTFNDVPNYNNLGANDFLGRTEDIDFAGNFFIRLWVDTNTAPPPTNTPVPTATPEPPRCPGQRFTDVCPEDYFFTPVLNLNDRGIVSGYNSSPPCATAAHVPCFRPYSNITRAQAAKLVALAPGATSTTTSQIFEDVPSSNPFYAEIQALASLGHMGGYPCGSPGEPCVAGNRPYFRPNASITRGQLSKIVANTAGYSEAHANQSFQDVPQSGAFYIWIERLATRGILGGYTCGGPEEPCGAGNLPYFRPNKEITRGQTAKIVHGVWPTD